MGLPMPTTTEKPSISETKETGNTDVSNDENQSQVAQQQQPKSEVELAAERVYLERMEDEYAKREGGA